MAIFNHVVRFPASAQVDTKIKTLGNEKLIPKSERKDKIKLYKCLKNKKVISGRPEMTENKSPSEKHFLCLYNMSESINHIPESSIIIRFQNRIRITFETGFRDIS